MAGVGACLFPSVDGLRGGSDGGSDAAQPDVSVNETGSDAGMPVNACADAYFCDDFERSTVLGAWTNLSTGKGGALDIVSVDAGHALRFSYPTTDASVGPVAYLSKSSIPAGNVTVGFDLYNEVSPGFFNGVVVTVAYSGTLRVTAVFQVSGSAGGVAIQIYDSSNGNEISYTSNPFPSGSIPPQQWGRGTLSFVITGTSGIATASFNGTVLATDSVNGIGKGLSNVDVGTNYSSSVNGSGALLFDNVRIDVSP